MKRTMLTALTLLVLIGLGSRVAMGADKTSLEPKAVIKKANHSATALCSNVVKVWKNPTTGKWESVSVDEAKTLTVTTPKNVQKTVQRTVVTPTSAAI